MIKPLPGYCLISPIEDTDKTAGGMYLPETSKDKPMKGKVVACGENTKKLICYVNEGDTVAYKKWTNQEINHEGKEYLLVHFNELLAIIE